MHRWVKIPGMKYKPYVCIACGGAPTKEDGSKEPEDAYWREGADVNYGDYLQLCCNCVRVLGELAGFITPEDAEDMTRQLKASAEQFYELREEHEKLKARVDLGVVGNK
jgi:hypothetical protein